MFRRLGAAVCLVACVAVAGCGGDDDDGDDALPLVDQIDEAVTAVERNLGGSQRYFEITATPQQVQVFVALDRATAVRQFLYLDGELAPIGERQPANGETFTADQLDFDPDTVFDQVRDEVPDSSLDTFSVIGANGDVRYAIYATSDAGGRLDIVVDGDGSVLEVGPADSNIVPVTSPSPSSPASEPSPPPVSPSGT